MIPARDGAACLIDITDAVGCTLTGLSLCGQGRGEGMHGVQIVKSDGYGREEDAIRVEKCRISEFSGTHCICPMSGARPCGITCLVPPVMACT